MKIKFKSITSKILITYLVVVVCSTVVTTLSFHSILYDDLEKRARSGLIRQAGEMAALLSIDNPEYKIPLVRPAHKQYSVFIYGRPVESDYLVINFAGQIESSSLPDKYPIGKSLKELPLELNFNQSEDRHFKVKQNGSLLVVKAPIGKPGEEKGAVITFAEISALEALNREILLLLLKSLFIATAIAIPLALLLGRYLIKPLHSLQDYAKAVARRRFDVRIDIKSDDELSELAHTFNEMASQLERYDISRHRFFQSASHELKTPLMSIQGFAEGIRDGVFSGEQANHALDVITKECQRLKSIVEEMIDITKLQSPGESYNLSNCDLTQIIDEVIDSLSGYAVEQKVEINTDCPSGLIVLGDPEKLRRLLGNLLTNAIRHAKSRVMVSGMAPEDSNDISILVKDDGQGFSPQDLEHAFDHFYKGPDGSTGLGLSIARIIVEEQNGIIKVSNDPSGGGIVEVNLPFNLS